MKKSQFLADIAELCMYCTYYCTYHQETSNGYGICHNPKSPHYQQETNVADSCDYHNASTTHL